MPKRRVKFQGIKECVSEGRDIDGLLVKSMGYSAGYHWVKALESRKITDGGKDIKAGDIFCWFEEWLR